GRRASAHERCADRGMTEHPGEGDLAQRHAPRVGDLAAEPLHHGDIRPEVVAAKDRLPEGHAVASPVVPRIEARGGSECAGQETMAQRAVAHDADAVGEAVRKRLYFL